MLLRSHFYSITAPSYLFKTPPNCSELSNHWSRSEYQQEDVASSVGAFKVPLYSPNDSVMGEKNCIYNTKFESQFIAVSSPAAIIEKKTKSIGTSTKKISKKRPKRAPKKCMPKKNTKVKRPDEREYLNLKKMCERATLQHKRMEDRMKW